MAKKDAHLTVRITPEELEEIREYASQNGYLQSDFVLKAIRTAMGKSGGLEEQLQNLTRRLIEVEKQLSDLKHQSLAA